MVDQHDEQSAQPNRSGAQNPPSNRSESKGKGKEVSLSQRLQASGKMAANAAFGGQSLPAPASHEKANSSSQYQQGSSEFFLSEGNRAKAGKSYDGQSLKGKEWAGAQQNAGFTEFIEETPQLETVAPIDPNFCVKSKLVSQQEEADGSDVVTLLDLPEELPTTEDLSDSISDSEATRLREAFFSQGSRQPIWDELLNFSPDFIRDPCPSQDSIPYTGTAEPDTVRDVWLQHWGDVLTGYTDEVWGDLGSLVREAKQELADLENQHAINPTGTETKALDRLRQILAHVRGNA